MRKEIDKFRMKDKKYHELNDEHSDLKTELQSNFAKIQSLADDFPDEEERKQQLGLLDETMTQLSELIKMNEEEIDLYAGNKFPEFKRRYPGIFKMFLKGNIDNSAFTHVLDTLTLVEEGQISLETGKEMGYHRFHK
tara:strand:+ start:6150 stop:6560 length:411 start_codon:yes stop_codon:yes gene_type:complete